MLVMQNIVLSECILLKLFSFFNNVEFVLFFEISNISNMLIYENGKQCDYLLRYHQMLNFLKEQCCVKLYSVVLTIFII